MPYRAIGARLASAVSIVLLAGCYHYLPIPAADAAALAPGAEVRLHLTPEGRTRVAPVLGPETAVVEGRTERQGGDSVSLVVSATGRTNGVTTRWVGERVTIPVDVVARGDRRVLDRRRSLLVGGGVAVGAALGYALLRAAAGGGAEGGAGTPVPTP
jgi:hypothetical protein